MLFARMEIIIIFSKRNSLMLDLRASDCILTNGSSSLMAHSVLQDSGSFKHVLE